MVFCLFKLRVLDYEYLYTRLLSPHPGECSLSFCNVTRGYIAAAPGFYLCRCLGKPRGGRRFSCASWAFYFRGVTCKEHSHLASAFYLQRRSVLSIWPLAIENKFVSSRLRFTGNYKYSSVDILKE